MDELSCYLALMLSEQASINTLNILKHQFGDLMTVFNANAKQLKALKLKPKVLANITNPPLALIDQHKAWLHASQLHHFIHADSTLYPDNLKQISGAPFGLFVHGNANLLTSAQIAIVGSRNASRTGLNNAHDFAKALAKLGITVTSGMALGIDGAAHHGALNAKGATIAVMATGLDQIYPASHQQLARQIISGAGAIVTEAPLGRKALPPLFPKRNRIISGMSLGVLVIEASLKSGSLITARLACEQGREVFALPGSIHSPVSRGCHALIKNGAKLVENCVDILEEYAHLHYLIAERTEQKSADLPADLNPTEKKLLNCLHYEERSVDELVEACGLTAQRVSAILVRLELAGCVKSSPSGYMINKSSVLE